MKKSKIGIIIVALIMIIAGLGLFIGGVIAVGGMEAAKKGLADHGVFIDRGFRVDINQSKGITASEKLDLSGEETVAFGIEDVNGFEFELGAGKMKVVQDVSKEEISIQTDGNCDIYVKNGILHVKTKTDLEEHSYVVNIPSEAVFDSIDISGNACELYIQYLEAKEVDIEVDAGLVEVDDLAVEKAEFDIGAGEIIVNDASAQECNVNVGMGNFKFYGDILKHGDIECGMGNAELCLEGNEEDYNYEIDCSAGNVEIGDYSIGGVATEKTINNHADATIEIECGMGNVTVGF